jgi:hypothetical protein
MQEAAEGVLMDARTVGFEIEAGDQQVGVAIAA